LKNLEILGLARTGITDNNLASLSRFVHLKSLNLQKNQVTNEGLEDSKKLKQLRRLHLQGTLVTPEGMARLKAAIPGLYVRPGKYERKGGELELSGWI